MDRLIGLEDVRGSNTGAMRANVECFRELDKLGAGYICSPQEDGYL
jgi:hypothetical protein